MGGHRTRTLASSRSLVAAAVVGMLAFLMTSPEALAAPKQAIPINVTSGAVDMVVNGNCSIREAIVAANTDSNVDACRAGSGADRINAPGTYVLTAADNDANGLPLISSKITINNADITRAAGAGAFRIVAVTSSGDLTLNGVTLSHGDAADCPTAVHTDPDAVCGGGIANLGTVNMMSSRVVDSEATNPNSGFTVAVGGAIANFATLNMRDSRFDSNTTSCSGGSPDPFGGCFALGGALFNSSSGTLTMTNSRVLDNDASCSGDNCFPVGGGITNDGTLTSDRSRVNDNTASCTGTGCIAIGGGIGFFGTVNLANSEVIGNTASCSTTDCVAIGGGLDNCCNGTLTVNNSRVANNTVSAPLGFAGGGGVHTDSGTVTLNNSSVTGNTASGASAAGGGILADGGAPVVLNHTKVSGNTPDNCEPTIGACS